MDLSPILGGGEIGRSGLGSFLSSASSIHSAGRKRPTIPYSRRGRALEGSPVYENLTSMEAGVQMGGGISEEELRLASGRRWSQGGRSSDTGNQTLSSVEGRRSACLSSPAKYAGLGGGRHSAKTTTTVAGGASHSHSTSDEDSGWNSGSPTLREFAWVPSGLSPDQILQYFASLPPEKIPYVGSMGDRWRTYQLTHQNPPQDSDPRKCHYLSSSETKAARAMMAQRKRECLGKGTVRALGKEALGSLACRQCGGGFGPGDLGVFSARLRGAVWHPGCFACSACDELLVDLIYYAEAATGRVLCGRHQAEASKPRCAACDEVIFAEECTEAEGRSWHIAHFACLQCDAELGGRRYVMRSGHPYCLGCYERVFDDLCAACRLPIDPDQPHLTHERVLWHATEACYACVACRRPLLGAPALPKKGRLFCSLDCYARAAVKATTAAASPALASARRLPPPPLPLPAKAAEDSDGDYETVQSFHAASPPLSPAEEAALRLSRDAMARMSLSLHQDQPASTASQQPRSSRAAPRDYQSPSRRRRHRSLSDLRNASGASSGKSSEGSSASSSTRQRRRPVVRFCASARDPPASAPRSRKSRRRRRGSSTEAKMAVAAGGQRKPSPLYDDPYGYARSEHADCSTCSSSSSSSSGGDDDEDYLQRDFLPRPPGQRHRRHLLHHSQQPQPPPPTPKRKPLKIRGSKLAALKQPQSSQQNCIVS